MSHTWKVVEDTRAVATVEVETEEGEVVAGIIIEGKSLVEEMERGAGVEAVAKGEEEAGVEVGEEEAGVEAGTTGEEEAGLEERGGEGGVKVIAGTGPDAPTSRYRKKEVILVAAEGGEVEAGAEIADAATIVTTTVATTIVTAEAIMLTSRKSSTTVLRKKLKIKVWRRRQAASLQQSQTPHDN